MRFKGHAQIFEHNVSDPSMVMTLACSLGREEVLSF